MEGESRKWLPHAQPPQKHNASHKSRYASSERKQHGFGEQLAQNTIAARTKSQAQGHFARTVGGPRSKQAAQVGTGRQQYQTRKKHQSSEKSPRGPVQIVAMKTRPRQRIRLITFFFGIASFQIRIHGLQIGSGLLQSDSWLQMSHRLNIQWLSRAFKIFSPDNWSWFTMGTKISEAKNNMVPWNPGGATPRMVNGCLLSRTTRPTTVRSS